MAFDAGSHGDAGKDDLQSGFLEHAEVDAHAVGLDVSTKYLGWQR